MNFPLFSVDVGAVTLLFLLYFVSSASAFLASLSLQYTAALDFWVLCLADLVESIKNPLQVLHSHTLCTQGHVWWGNNRVHSLNWSLALITAENWSKILVFDWRLGSEEALGEALIHLHLSYLFIISGTILLYGLEYFENVNFHLWEFSIQATY